MWSWGREAIARVNNPPLSAYRFMWLLVMFDLPVGTKAERRAATKSRWGNAANRNKEHGQSLSLEL